MRRLSKYLFAPKAQNIPHIIMSAPVPEEHTPSLRPPPVSSNGHGAPPKPGLVPTNTVTIKDKDNMTVRTRIDPTLAVADVVSRLCASLHMDAPTKYALRDETDELVTNDNLFKKIKGKVPLKLVSAPAIEAEEILEKLQARDARLALALTSLRKYIREEPFAETFLQRGGLAELVDVIHVSHGNVLAYALSALQNLMELEYGWADLDDLFILRIVQILASEQSLINVCRPATAILKKLVEADPMSAPAAMGAGPSRVVPRTPPPGSVYRFGFEVVFELMRKEPRLLQTVVARLESAETTIVMYSMMLINSLLAHATDARWDEFTGELERLNVRKAVIRLMSLHTYEDLTSCILDFQANMVQVLYRDKRTLVEPELDSAQAQALHYIWTCGGQAEEMDVNVGVLKWRKLGFDSEDLTQEFGEVGVLGLRCLEYFVDNDREYFAKVVREQNSRGAERRCPIAKASNEIVDLLAEHWAVYAPGYSTATTFQPFFLNFKKVYRLATLFFLRMWNESGAARGDFSRVVALTRSQVKVALRQENVRAWHEVEHDFLESEYRAVRDRQMQELEKEDVIMSKIPVRTLRAKLYKESYEFVRQQRVHCLLQGAWFMNGTPVSQSSRDTIRRPRRQWRFMRLDNATKYLYYVDSDVKFPIRHGLEDLPERVEVSLISEVATSTCAPFPIARHSDLQLGTSSQLPPSPLSFSLLTASGSSLADQIAPDKARWSDWTDGLNMLRPGGHASSQETEAFVQALTEIGLKIKLLDLSGEKVEIPSGLNAGPPPTNGDFFFSELSY